MKFLLAFTFVATIQAYHPGYYQPHVLYPQFYQTFPNIRIPKPFMEQPIESGQRNDCKNNLGEVVPCHKSFAEKVDQSRIKTFKRPVNPLFYSISQDDEENSLVFNDTLPSIEDIEEGCQDVKEGQFKDNIDSFRKFADFWDGMKDYDYYGWKLFGQNEEDLIFRKLTGIDEFFDKDFNGGESLVADMNDICANPSAEDAEANLWNISDKYNPPQLEIGEKVPYYTENVCGYEKSQSQGWSPDFENIDGANIADIRIIPNFRFVIRDIQENSTDWKCANRVTKYLNGLIDIMIKISPLFPAYSQPANN